MWPPFFRGHPYIWRTTVRHDNIFIDSHCSLSVPFRFSVFVHFLLVDLWNLSVQHLANERPRMFIQSWITSPNSSTLSDSYPAGIQCANSSHASIVSVECNTSFLFAVVTVSDGRQRLCWGAVGSPFQCSPWVFEPEVWYQLWFVNPYKSVFHGVLGYQLVVLGYQLWIMKR